MGRTLSEQVSASHPASLQQAYDGTKFSGSAAAVLDAPAAWMPTSPSVKTHALSGRALLAETGRNSRQGHTPRDYDAARKYMYSVADNVNVSGVRGVVAAYSGVFVPGRSSNGGDYKERGDQNKDGYIDSEGINAEHVWPQSFFDMKSPMRSDLHNLMPTFMHPNGLRGHLPFGQVNGGVEYSNNGGAKLGNGVFEPPNASKGRVARALLYFYTRYQGQAIFHGDFGASFWNSKLETLLQWNRSFPPDANERRRNGLVEQFQGNRNPFIDDPSLADRIGVEGFRFNGGDRSIGSGRPIHSRHRRHHGRGWN